MEPFSLERCCYQLTLTIFERQVTLATDSPRIHELLSHAFGSRYFAGRGGPERTFYCSVACDEPWDMVMGFPDGIFLSRASKETPSSYDLFRWSPEGVVPAGFYSYHKSPDLSLVPTDLEIFASHFQREVLEHLLKDEPSLRLIHGGAIAHGGCGLL